MDINGEDVVKTEDKEREPRSVLPEEIKKFMQQCERGRGILRIKKKVDQSRINQKLESIKGETGDIDKGEGHWI